MLQSGLVHIPRSLLFVNASIFNGKAWIGEVFDLHLSRLYH